MNPIAMFFGLALLAVSVFYIASPFRSYELQKQSPKRSSAGKNKGEQRDGLKVSPEKQRQAVLFALRDLDFDYQAGKVAEEDYQGLRASLLTQAAQLIEIQERQKEDSIEALVQSRRQARSAPQRQQSVQPESKEMSNGSAGKLCQHCQAPLPAGAKFCSKCGTPVEEITCPKCKQSLGPDDRFCPSCGTAVQAKKEVTNSTAQPEGE